METAGLRPHRIWDGGQRMTVAAGPAREQNMLKSSDESSIRSCGLPLRAGALLIIASALIGATDLNNVPDQPLQAPDGVTALSGQVMDAAGNGLAGVQLLVGDVKTVSDDAGRFLVAPAIPGKTVLQIDGRRAGAKHDTDYGFY
jgi:hypothetical protein